MSETQSQILGSFGEKIAAKFLRKNGYKIISRNVHVSKNELDIIAEDDQHVVFAEVKTRSYLNTEALNSGIPSLAVDEKKRDHTLKAVRGYLTTHQVNKQIRIDVIEVYLLKSHGFLKRPTVVKINHIRNAFDARGRKLH